MEKADVLEMTVHYLRERKRLEQKHQGTFIGNFVFRSFVISIVQSLFVLNRQRDELLSMFVYQILSDSFIRAETRD